MRISKHVFIVCLVSYHQTFLRSQMCIIKTYIYIRNTFGFFACYDTVLSVNPSVEKWITAKNVFLSGYYWFILPLIVLQLYENLFIFSILFYCHSSSFKMYQLVCIYNWAFLLLMILYVSVTLPVYTTHNQFVGNNRSLTRV